MAFVVVVALRWLDSYFAQHKACYFLLGVQHDCGNNVTTSRLAIAILLATGFVLLPVLMFRSNKK